VNRALCSQPVQVGSAGITPGGSLVLDVTEVVIPPNDAFAAATDAGTLPAHLTVDTTLATLETGEPAFLSCATTNKTVWYTVTRPTSAVVTLSTAGSDFNTVMAVYTGSSLGSLTEVGCNNDFNGTPQSQLTFLASAGVTYHVQIGGFLFPLAGNLVFELSEIAAPPNDAFGSAVDVGAPPAQRTANTTLATVESGEPTSLSCGTVGKTVWYTVTRPTPAVVTVSTAGSGFDTVLAVYTGGSLGSLSQVGCNNDVNGTPQSQLSFTATANTVYRIQVGGAGGSAGSVVLNVTATPMFALTVAPSGVGAGTISSSPAGIDCGADCTEAYVDGTLVTLTATPAPGWTFGGWGGACSAMASCQVTMDAAKSVIATFVRQNVGVQLGQLPNPPPGSTPSLRAILSARPTCGPIVQIQFGVAGSPFDNAQITIVAPVGGPAGRTTGFTYTPPPGTTSVTLTIQRVVQSGGAMVKPIRFRDGCGDWPTFLGGGVDAFK
jgi:hypothetical protein